MTTFRQIEANRRNARKSTGPVTEEGKQSSRCNAVRHGLTAETVIGALEDAQDYQVFEAAIVADYWRVGGCQSLRSTFGVVWRIEQRNGTIRPGLVPEKGISSR
jgi:hypothetical protein